MVNSLPLIPAKRYFTISEVSKLCGVKPHVLRYWEQEFAQLRPMKRRGNRRYYQLHDVELIRQIRQLLHEQGFTIVGARNRLQEILPGPSGELLGNEEAVYLQRQPNSDKDDSRSVFNALPQIEASVKTPADRASTPDAAASRPLLAAVRRELITIRDLLGPSD